MSYPSKAGYRKVLRHDLMLNDWTPRRLKTVREELGLSQEDIASLIGVTRAAIYYIERGDSTNPWSIQLYGIILERCYALKYGYAPAFRKIGQDSFMDDKRIKHLSEKSERIKNTYEPEL